MNMAWLDVNNYKKKPFELDESNLTVMSLSEAAELIKYIEGIAARRQDELKIHSGNIVKIVDHLRNTGIIEAK